MSSPLRSASRDATAPSSRGGADSAAAEAGLREGDVILAVNGDPIKGVTISATIGSVGVGARVELRSRVTARRAGSPGPLPTPTASFVEGRRIAPGLAGALLGETRSSRGVPALPVGTVEANSPAWHAGLREGDRLLEVNGQRVASLRDVTQVLRQTGDILTLRIQRGDDLLVLARR